MNKTITDRIQKIEVFAREKMGVDYKTYIATNENYLPHVIENLIRIENGELLAEEAKNAASRWDKENRTNEEYALDMIYNWLAEDYTKKRIFSSVKRHLNLEESEWDIINTGTDKKRGFTPPNKANRFDDTRKNKNAENRFCAIGFQNLFCAEGARRVVFRRLFLRVVRRMRYSREPEWWSQKPAKRQKKPAWNS